MPGERNIDDVDAGVSYQQAPVALQRLLDKVKARKKSVHEETDRSKNGLPQVAFAAGEYAGRFLENMDKASGIPYASRKVIKRVTAPFLSEKPAAGAEGTILWKGIRNDTARTIKRMRQNDPTRYRQLRGFSALNNLIELANWETKYPKSVLQTVWKKLRNGGQQQPVKSLAPGTMAWRTKLAGALRGEKLPTALSAMLDEILFEGADPRPRNTLGEFVPPSEGGPDRNAIATTYGSVQQQEIQKQRGISREIGQAALAAPLVGAGGTAGGLAIKGLVEKLKTRKALSKTIMR